MNSYPETTQPPLPFNTRADLGAEKLKRLADARAQEKHHQGIPKDSVSWLKHFFPKTFNSAPGTGLLELWDYIDSVIQIQTPSGKEATSPPTTFTTPTPTPAQNFLLVLARGGGKSASAEAIGPRLGSQGKAHFVLYVRATQNRANESVQNIAALLEDPTFAAAYPNMSQREMGKFNNVKGWRINTLRAKDFNVVALGLDASVRGVRLDSYRPDVIIFDDIDDKKDSPLIIEKKINTLKYDILPAGASNTRVIGCQNLIHENSIFNQLVTDKADFLFGRQISGPHPAVTDLLYDYNPTTKKYFITSGTATWPEGQDLETCERQINQWGPSTFLREAQHEIDEDGGIWTDIVWQRVSVPHISDVLACVCAVDPAVTTTDHSDSNGIQISCITTGNKIVQLYSDEEKNTPQGTLTRAIKKSLVFGAQQIAIETNQGGLTWETVYEKSCENLEEEFTVLEEFNIKALEEGRSIVPLPDWAQVIRHAKSITPGIRYYEILPEFISVTATSSTGNKLQRNAMMLASYERHEVYHAPGSRQLEKALRRFPKKPMDLADGAYWAWSIVYALFESELETISLGDFVSTRLAPDQITI